MSRAPHADGSCALQLAANLGEVTQDRDELQACKAALEAEVRQLQADLRSWQGRCSTSEDSCTKLRGDLGQAQAAHAQLKVHAPCSYLGAFHRALDEIWQISQA